MEAWRGGVQTGYVSRVLTGPAETSEAVQLSCAKSPGFAGTPVGVGQMGLKMRFSIKSAGGGETLLVLWADPKEDFERMLMLMMKANSDATEAAFNKARERSELEKKKSSYSMRQWAELATKYRHWDD
ncbi:hypothetical protein IC232_13840 [Microvirga sp. BT688]|uniref:hypothetical protein n=1 Tax=Microvirga sp. TaxID=1873136 RepID=UPI00168273E1|nr:hypothetical protein [Microvirga sp.]MBD2747781.1 hypothetical protein [Microvirga sp.]